MSHVCPLMVKVRMDNTACDFPELCTRTLFMPSAYCFWARFHEIDPHTLKPINPNNTQRELFQHGEETHEDLDADR